MKKVLAILLIVSMAISMVGCSNENNNGTNGGKGKICFIATQLGDLSFNDNGWDGIQRVGSKYGYEVKVIESGMDSSKYETAFLDLCDSDYDYIVSQSGNGWGDIVFKYAADYPEKKFIVFDCAKTTTVPADNVLCIAYCANEGSYLVGYVCAAMSQTGKIATGANRDNPNINDFFTGFINGALQYNPEIKVATAYNTVPGDATAMGEIAEQLFNAGVDVMFSVAGAAGLGIFKSAYEKNKLAVGVDSDQYLTYSNSETPELATVIMTSMIKNIGDTLVSTFDAIENGTVQWGSLSVLGVKEGGVALADNENYQKLVGEDVRKSVNELIDQIKNGEITIPSYFDFTDDAQFRDLVNSVSINN